MHSVRFSKTSVKQIRKRGEKFKDKVKKIGNKLSKNPQALKAEKLKKPLNFVYSYHFSFSGNAYRLAFTVNKAGKIVNIILVAPRENFYKKLKRILK